jgi:hypothetical protein
MVCLPAWELGELLAAPRRTNLPGYGHSQGPWNRTDPLMRHTGAHQLLFRLMMLLYCVNACGSTNKNT